MVPSQTEIDVVLLVVTSGEEGMVAARVEDE
jgi:hypothetical protein